MHSNGFTGIEEEPLHIYDFCNKGLHRGNDGFIELDQTLRLLHPLMYEMDINAFLVRKNNPFSWIKVDAVQACLHFKGNEFDPFDVFRILHLTADTPCTHAYNNSISSFLTINFLSALTMSISGRWAGAVGGLFSHRVFNEYGRALYHLIFIIPKY
jgi:hypothetical protein